MENKKEGKKLDTTLLILAALVVVAVAATFWKGGWQLTITGFMQSSQLFQTVWFRLILGFILGGLVQGLVPNAIIAKWLGHASGFKGILIGSYIGIVIPGGPYVWLPVIAAIYRAGAGVGPVVALIVGRGLLSLQMLLVWQIPFLGMEITAARFAACLLLPPLAGLIGRSVFQAISKLVKTDDEIAYIPGGAGQQPDSGESADPAPGKE